MLPFANLSGDAQQEFFSDGITEEITSALAKIPDLRVVARTSAYRFKNEKVDARAVGQALSATHLIEGSVRKDGDRLRITAQLIEAGNGVHMWTENYNRELTDVFAIQEEIATAIARALQMPLGLQPGARLVASRSIDPESYEQFLRAKTLRRQQNRGVPQAIQILEPLVERNPDFAPAWGVLAATYIPMPGYVGIGEERRRRIAEYWPKAEVAARRAIQLDPNLAEGYWALSNVMRTRGKLVDADDLIGRALALDPNNPDILTVHMVNLSKAGRLREALAVARQLLALEPYVPAFNSSVGEILWEKTGTMKLPSRCSSLLPESVWSPSASP